MKKTINAAVLQFSPILHQPQRNMERVRELLKNEEEKLTSLDLLLLPESFILGPIQKLKLNDAKEAQKVGLKGLAEMAEKWGFYLLGGTMPEVEEEDIYNTAFLFNPAGELIDAYRKVHLYSLGEFREGEIYTPGSEVRALRTELASIGLGICYELRFPRIFQSLREEGVEIICAPATWDYPVYEQWGLLNRTRALEVQAYLLAANITGNYPLSWFFGGSMAVSFKGQVMASMAEEEGLLFSSFDLDALRDYRREYPYYQDY